MGKIKKILENELVGGTQTTDVYPITSTKAVYDTDNKVLDDYIQHLKKTSTFAGIATPTTNPGTPDGPVFYIAPQAGAYSNFGNTEIDSTGIFTWDGTSWSFEKLDFIVNDSIVNDLTTGGEKNALSAEMGKVLNENAEAKYTELMNRIDSPMVTWEKTTEDADIEWLDNTRLAWNNATESVAGYKTSAKIILLDPNTKYVLFPYISKKPYSYYGAIFFDTEFNVDESLKVPKSFNNDFRNVVVEIPDNIKAMRVSKTDGEDFSFTEYQTIDELANALVDLTSLEEVQAETKVGGVLYANKQYAQSEGIINNTNARYKRIRVLEGETYTITGSSVENLAVWRWNDKYSKTILSNVDITLSEVYGTKKLFVEITAPKNAVWLYVGWVVSGNMAIDEGHIYRKKTGAMDALRNIRTSEYPQFDFSSYYQDGKSDNFYDYVTPLDNDAYIVVGQSNVDGRINNAQFPATITFGEKTIETSKNLPNLQFMKSATGSVYDELTKTFQPRNNTGAWAFDEIIYNLLDKLVYNPSSNSRDFYVLKATRGATTIEPRYNIAFSADIKVLKDKGWESMMIHLKNLIKSAKLQNPNLRFKGIIIYECEGDMTVTKYPYQYYNNLGGMIAYIRGLVGQPNIPVFIGAPATNLPDYNQLVVDDMRELAKNMNDIHLIEIGESEGWVDDGMNVHFNAAAATRIGGLYYQAMVDAKII